MRRTRWLAAALVAVALSPLSLLAQANAVVAGTVTNAQGGPENGVMVRIERLNVGTTTAQNGTYRLVIPAARVGASASVAVSASRQGLATVTRNVTLTPGAELTQNFVLAASAVELQGLVVTALGITREERSIPNAVQQVSGDELSRSEPNIVASLSGKVSGVNITTAGAQGGSSRIVIRGPSSLTGNNQPLFVVDGVPIDNGSPRLEGYGGRDYGNGAQDINPSDVESISVLKGPNAAALYGSRAANGAIIITTKSGRGTGGRSQVTVSQYGTLEDALRLPSFQNAFGQGLNGQFEYVDGNGGGTYDDYDESWGPPLDGRAIPQYNSPVVGGVRQATPWVANPDNVSSFFDRAYTLTTDASFATSTDRANVRLSVARMDQDAMMPGQKLGRTSVGLNGGIDVSSRLRATTSVQYVGSDGRNRPGIGYDETNPLGQFIWFGRQVDMQDLRQNYRNQRPEDDSQAGMPYSWNYSFHPNPYFLQMSNQNQDSRDRLIGNVALNYEFTDWLSAMARVGTDWYSDDRKVTYAALNYGVGAFNPMTLDTDAVGSNGAFGFQQIGFQETNADFLVNAKPYVSDAFSLVATLGGNQRKVRRQETYTYVSDLVVPGIYSTSNALNTPTDEDYLTRRQINSLYGQAELGYNDYLFVTLTGRNDWSSTLPEDNNSYFYPSVSGALVFTDAVPSLDMGGALTYGKLRASWARVGNDAQPYQLRATYLKQDPFNGIPTFTVPGTLPNDQLRPEETTSIEVGTELRFFDDRIGLDLSYYNSTTRDQIMPVQVSRSSGYASRIVNAGTVRNRGVEVLLNATPVEKGDFRWETTVSWAKNSNRVVSLAEGTDGLLLGSFWGLNIEARRGQPYGSLVGYEYQRDSQGRIVVDEAGLPTANPTVTVLGNYQPDWSGSLTNTFGYKGLSLKVLLDTKQGGSIYSTTHMWGTYAGVLDETAAGRCSLDDTYDNLPACTAATGIVVPGVRVTEAGDTVTNDIVTDAQNYWASLYGLHEAHVFDASFVKLRELTLGYDVPGSMTRRFGLSRMNVALIGRNLALWAKAPHIDPETAFDASNVQGLEFAQMPTARSIGLSVSVTP